MSIKNITIMLEVTWKTKAWLVFSYLSKQACCLFWSWKTSYRNYWLQNLEFLLLHFKLVCTEDLILCLGDEKLELRRECHEHLGCVSGFSLPSLKWTDFWTPHIFSEPERNPVFSLLLPRLWCSLSQPDLPALQSLSSTSLFWPWEYSIFKPCPLVSA